MASAAYWYCVITDGCIAGVKYVCIAGWQRAWTPAKPCKKCATCSSSPETWTGAMKPARCLCTSCSRYAMLHCLIGLDSWLCGHKASGTSASAEYVLCTGRCLLPYVLEIVAHPLFINCFVSSRTSLRRASRIDSV